MPNVPELPQDSATRAYALVALNGRLEWVPLTDDAGKPVHPVRLASVLAAKR